MLQFFAHSIDNGDGVRVATLLQDRQVNGSLAVDAHDVVLQRIGVFGDADIRDPHRVFSGKLDRHTVDIVNLADLAVGVDVVVVLPDLHVAGGQDEIRFVHRSEPRPSGSIGALRA